MVAAVIILALIFIPRIQANNQLDDCRANLKLIGTALEFYASDNAGAYPPALDYLTRPAGTRGRYGAGDAYLKEMPCCPACGKDTYSESYLSSQNPDAYIVYCSGRNHDKAGLEENAPIMGAATGMQDKSRELIASFSRSLSHQAAKAQEQAAQAQKEAAQAQMQAAEAEAQIAKAKEQAATTQSDYEAGDTIKFGNYPQNSGSTPEPIDWLVLENDGHTALLVSKYALDCKQFNNKDTLVNWRDCSLRRWLNDDFFRRAFSAEERRRIVKGVVYTGDNPEHGMPGCGETRDYVFCLSINEANDLLSSAGAMGCRPTLYAKSRNAYAGENGNCYYWLRSPGNQYNCAAGVHSYGTVGYDGDYVYHDYVAVRPALRIKL